ncbi:hypothetical protein M947_10080 [Sulfurimonas hongkongensis]|uniref:Glycosyl transferase family 1 domain-containing protein n=1 Tax=Sulfurimonas hongkongensis TaxID=1172190 RepID=T0J3P9_9BACT|nr:hypothetical protein M947_10080 [Sulfurimonas hongkongensis]
MELDSLKLAIMLSKFTEITLIIKEKHFIHEQCLNNSDYISLNYKTISFKSTFSPSIIFTVRDIVKKNNIKNVIFLGASELKSLYFSFLGLDINLIVRHGTTKSTPKKDWFHKLIYSDVAYHVAISKHLSKNVKEIVPFGKKTQLVTIYPSMSKEISNKEKIYTSELKLLHVGRIAPGKGLKEALQACKILYDNKIVFSLNSYGSMFDTYKNEFESFLQTLSYKNSFNPCGFTNNIYDEYSKHDIFIFPSKGEGFGNVIMEAISHGIIVLAFNNTAVTNFKELGFHIHLVEDANIKALSKKLLYIAQNLDKEIDFAKVNIELAKEVFTQEREQNQYLQLLE